MVKDVPTEKNIDHAILRVALAQELNRCEDVRIQLNGHELEVPSEDAAERYWDHSEKRGSDFATMKLIRFDPALLMANNKVTVTFPEDQRGAVGSVVNRLGISDRL